MNPAFIDKCVIAGRLRMLNATEKRKLDAQT